MISFAAITVSSLSHYELPITDFAVQEPDSLSFLYIAQFQFHGNVCCHKIPAEKI